MGVCVCVCGGGGGGMEQNENSRQQGKHTKTIMILVNSPILRATTAGEAHKNDHDSGELANSIGYYSRGSTSKTTTTTKRS